MNNSVYYRTGKYDAKKGYIPARQTVSTVAQLDEHRTKFVERVQNDEEFRKVVGWTKKPVAEYVAEYHRRPNDEAYAPEGATMCSRLYELGTYDKSVSVKEGEIAVKTVKGTSVTFDVTQKVDPPPISRFDDSHLDAEPAEDVTRISGFGEAALLLCMRRRLIEKLHIYTYVGDIVLCVNPYMRIPAMEKIHGDRWCPFYVEGEERKKYQLGSDPHSYAAAYLAYWGQRCPEDYSMEGKVDQSCIVSGESGAGKTVACSLIMKFLARCSLWRQEEIDGKAAESLPTGSITNRIGGCSPFLEAFGNAKTVMNDNSSRFGKFTKVIFHDGLIVAAKMENYLLERARLVGQGIHERNFHIFYFLIKGSQGPNYKSFLTDEQRTLFDLADVTEYDIIKRTPIIAREEESHPGFDEFKMTAPLSERGNHDETGVVAALEDTGMPRAEQSNIWTVIAICLKLGNLRFKDAMGEGGNMGSKVTNREVLNSISKILLASTPDCPLFTPDALEDALGSIVTVMRSERYSRPVPARQAVENRDAFIKALYAQVFDTLFKLCNRKLNPDGIEEGPEYPFVGILDIFGFEVFQKNSLEQLCINFANEKLQNLFNEHVFMNEKKVYESQGMDTSDKNVFPPYRDNGPCCDLVAKSSGKFVGIFPGLDSLSVNDDATDNGFLESLIKTFGRGRAPPKNCKIASLKRAAQFFQAADFVNEKFQIRHFAGPVVYHIEGFLDKNRDKVATNIRELCQALQDTLFKFPCLDTDAASPRAKSPGRKGKQMKTIASKFRQQLTNLANTLKSTNPHYVRCVKPNDFHMRPIDGNICFDEWKTYEQLLFAGVMECVKIKRSGFPFRESHDTFFRNRIIRCKLHKFIPELSPDMDPKAGCEIVVRKTLPELAEADEDTGLRRKFWFMGSSLVMGKDNLVEVMSHWLQRQAANRLVGACRFGTVRVSVQLFVDIVRELQRLWRLVLFHRRFIPAVEMCQEVWRKFHTAHVFRDVARSLSRIQITRESTQLLQATFRAARAKGRFLALWRARAVQNANRALQEVGASVVTASRTFIATAALQGRLLRSLHNLRKTFRLQAHFRGARVRAEHRARVQRLRNTTECAVTGVAVWRSLPSRIEFSRSRQAAQLLQAVARGRIESRRFATSYKRVVLVQAAARRCVYRSRFLRRLAKTIIWQRWLRLQAVRQLASRSTRSGLRIVRWMKGLLFATRTQQFLNQMDYACSNGDVETIAALLECEGEFRCLQPLRAEVVPSVGRRLVAVNSLVNLRDPTFFTSFVHSAAKSGSAAAVQLLVDSKAWVDVRDAALESPLHQTCSNGDPMLEVNRILVAHATWRTGGGLLNAALEESKLIAQEASLARRSGGRRGSFRQPPKSEAAKKRADALASNKGAMKWIVSIGAQSLREQTVLDCALSCVDYPKDETVALLLSERAQSSIDVEKVLEDEYQQKQNLLIVEARRRKQMEDQEEEERHKDQLYNLLFLDNSQPDRISLETRAALRAKEQQEQQQHISEHLMMSAVVTLQAVVRMWLRRRARDEEAIMDLRPLAERAADAQRRREEARKKREEQAALKRAKQRRAAHGTRRALKVLSPEEEKELLKEQEDAAARVLTMKDRAAARARHVAEKRTERQKMRKEQLIRERRNRQRRKVEEEQRRYRAEQEKKRAKQANNSQPGSPGGVDDQRSPTGTSDIPEGLMRSEGTATSSSASRAAGTQSPAAGSLDEGKGRLPELHPEDESYDVLSHTYTLDPVKGINPNELGEQVTTLATVSNSANGGAPLRGGTAAGANAPDHHGAKLSVDEQYQVLKATYPDRKEYVKSIASVRAAQQQQAALQTQIAQAQLRLQQNEQKLRGLEAKNYLTELHGRVEASAKQGVDVPMFRKPTSEDIEAFHNEYEKHDIDARGLAKNSECRSLLMQALHTYRAVVARGTAPRTQSSDAQKWLYKDDAGDIHGPFSEQQMQHWYRRGFFSPDLLIANGTMPASFSPLKSVFIHDIGSAFDSQHLRAAFEEGSLQALYEHVAQQSKFVPRHHTQATIESAQDGAEHDANEPSDLDARLQAVSVVEHGSSTDDESA